MAATRFPLTIRLMVLVLIVQAGAFSAESQVEAADQEGRPLPPGALYRLGTSAWRDCVGGNGLAYSPDGKRLAYIRLIRDVRILDAKTGQIVRTLRPELPAGEEPQHMQLAWSPDGGDIALRTVPGRVIGIDPATGKQRW